MESSAAFIKSNKLNNPMNPTSTLFFIAGKWTRGMIQNSTCTAINSAQRADRTMELSLKQCNRQCIKRAKQAKERREDEGEGEGASLVEGRGSSRVEDVANNQEGQKQNKKVKRKEKKRRKPTKRKEKREKNGRRTNNRLA